MNRRPLLLLVAAAAMATMLWALLHKEATEMAPGATAPVLPTASTAPAVPAAPAEPPPAAAIPERTAAATDQPGLPADVVWIEVLVVDATTQAPVPDADVLWTIDGDWQRARTMAAEDIELFVRDVERFAQRFGRRTRSDAQGRARIGARPDGASVYARLGHRYGLANVGGRRPVPAEGWRVALEVDCTLRVQVQDAAGAPAIGVPVDVIGCDGDGKLLPGSMFGRSLFSSEPAGFVEFPHAQIWLRHGGSSGQRDKNPVRWIAKTQVPGFDDPGVAFDRDAPPQEPIVLRLPPTGRVLARLLHAARPLQANVQFTAFRGAEGSAEARNRATPSTPDADGWATWPHVALGGMLHVVARIDNTTVEVDTEAPQLPGQEVRVDLSTAALITLCGRFVGPDGAPFVQTTVNTSYSAAARMGSIRLQTDAQGRFRWFVGEPKAQPASLQSFVVIHAAPDGTPLRADVAPRPLAAGENELGDVQLVAGQLILAGRFVYDGAQRPPKVVPSFDFAIEALADRPGSAGEERWNMVHGLAQIRRPDGTFELRGGTRPVRHRLVVRSQDYLPFEPIEFRLGTKDLSVALDTGHALLAVCNVPDGMPPRLFAGVLRRTGEGAADGKRWPSTPARGESGPFELRWPAVPAGTYALDVLATGQERPFATIDDVVVPLPPGGDARLLAIDVLAEAATLQLHLRPEGPPPAQTPMGPTLAFVLPQANDQHWQGIEVQGDDLVLPVPRGPIELLVLRSGYQPCRMQNVLREVTAALQPWPTVELRFAGLPPLPEGAQLMVELSPLQPVPVGERTYQTEHNRGPLHIWMQPFYRRFEVRDGSATLVVGDGALRIQVWLYPPNGAPARALANIEPAQLIGGPGLPPVVVRVPEQEVRAALAGAQNGGK